MGQFETLTQHPPPPHPGTGYSLVGSGIKISVWYGSGYIFTRVYHTFYFFWEFQGQSGIKWKPWLTFPNWVHTVSIGHCLACNSCRMLLLHFRSYSQVCCSQKPGNFGLMIKTLVWFSPHRILNLVGPGSGHKSCFFAGSVQVRAKPGGGGHSSYSSVHMRDQRKRVVFWG